MKVEYFLNKLFEENPIVMNSSRNIVLHLDKTMNRGKLQHNLDVLARELHMEVDKAAEDAIKYQPRHERIFVPACEPDADDHKEFPAEDELKPKWKNI